MPKGLIVIALFFLFISCINVQAQPYSFNRNTLQRIIPVEVMPKVDAVKLLKEDALNTNKEAPYRFGYKHVVSFDMNNSGLRQVLKNRSILWRLDIKCPDAYSVNLIFDQFNIPPGAQLYLYSKDKSYIVGPYTSRDVNKYRTLGTGICRGEEVIVEYYEPFYAAFHGQVRIAGVTHAYKDPFHEAKSFGQAGSCDSNVICPIASAWQDDKRAVAMIIVDGTSLCTGAMLGNTTLDGTPYFLTAFHCYDTTVTTWVFMFNYESPTCNPSVNGPMTMTENGAQLVSLNSRSDFCLLELFSEPDTSYHIYYDGWSSVDSVPNSETGIHHPMGDVKKISFANSAAVSDGWPQGTFDGTHWNVNWNIGDTESGSSGSPLFDQNHHVVGQLHGGTSQCGGRDMHDLYGKFSVSWNGDNSSVRLKDWLEPHDSGIASLHGYYPHQPVDTIDAQLYSVVSPSTTNCAGDTIYPVINVKNLGANPLTYLLIQYSIDGGNPISYTWKGRITTYTNINITLPAFAVSVGKHIFYAVLKNPNNGIDQDVSDNNLTMGFNVISGTDITVEVMTDDFPSETSYDLINESGDTVLHRQDFIDPETDYKNKMCLLPGCYTFRIYDTGDDGICCAYGNGYYKIYNSEGDTFATGGQFDSLDVKNFCAFSNGVVNLNQNEGVNVYPNPTTGAVKVEWVKHFDRIDILILNSVGQEMKKQSFFDMNNGSVNLHPLAPGVYFLKINIGEEEIIRKVVLLNP